MANAERDQNDVPTLLAYYPTNADNERIYANATTHGLKVSDGTTGNDQGPQNAYRDQNGVPGIMAVSSVDGVTPVVVYTDGAGNLLVQST